MPSIHISPHNKIAYLFLTLALIMLVGIFFGLFNTSYGAKIIITPNPEDIDVSFEAQIIEQGVDIESTENNEQNILIGRILETIQEGQEKTIAESTQTMEDYAEGEIILTNNTWKTINFVASTRFESPNGLIFRAINRIRILSKEKASILVRADKKGAEYNIEPTTFTIPNLKDPYLKENIISTSEKPMDGGIKMAGIIMQSDIADAKTQLKEKLYSIGISEIEQQLPESSLKIVIQSNIIEEKTDAEPGDEKAEFTTLMKVKIGAVAFQEQELLNLAINSLKLKIPDGKELTAYEPESLSYRLANYNTPEQTALLEVQFRGHMAINLDNQMLEKTKFLGLSSKQAIDYLKSFKEIDHVKIKLWPPLIIKKLPQISDKINIIVKKFK